MLDIDPTIVSAGQPIPGELRSAAADNRSWTQSRLAIGIIMKSIS